MISVPTINYDCYIFKSTLKQSVGNDYLTGQFMNKNHIEFVFIPSPTIVSDEDIYTATDRPENPPIDDCVDQLPVLLTTTFMGFFTALNTIFAFILFRKINRQETKK